VRLAWGEFRNLRFRRCKLHQVRKIAVTETTVVSETFFTYSIVAVGMSQTDSGYVDPRSKITHPIEPGQIYEDDRTGDELTLVYCSDDAALLQDNETGAHRLERRRDFEANVGSGRYELQSKTDSAVASSNISMLRDLLDQYESESGRTAAHKSEAIEEAIELLEHNGQPDDHETIDLEAISGIGSAAAESLRANGFSTKGDVRNADTSEITEVSNMGAKNTERLIEHVNE